MEVGEGSMAPEKVGGEYWGEVPLDILRLRDRRQFEVTFDLM